MNSNLQNQPVIDVMPNNGVNNGAGSGFGNGFGSGLMPPSAYAGFWRRLIAYAIDSLIIGVPLMVIGRMFGWVAINQTANSAEAYTTSDGFALFAGVVATLYFVLMESSNKQATFGKSVFGLRVTNMQGGRISLGQAFIRYFARVLGSKRIKICANFLRQNEKQVLQAFKNKRSKVSSNFTLLCP